jgi:hypothetical protein
LMVNNVLHAQSNLFGIQILVIVKHAKEEWLLLKKVVDALPISIGIRPIVSNAMFPNILIFQLSNACIVRISKFMMLQPNNV